jgi:hypothetical protein
LENISQFDDRLKIQLLNRLVRMINAEPGKSPANYMPGAHAVNLRGERDEGILEE